MKDSTETGQEQWEQDKVRRRREKAKKTSSQIEVNKTINQKLNNK